MDEVTRLTIQAQIAAEEALISRYVSGRRFFREGTDTLGKINAQIEEKTQLVKDLKDSLVCYVGIPE